MVVAAPFAAFADVIPTFVSPISIDMSPQYPSPGQNVTLTVADPANDPSNTSYAWSVNGTVTEQGIGQKSLTLSAPAAGASETVNVTASENSVVRASARMAVTPASIDIVWEGDTYRPPFYIGRPLPNGQSALTAIAFPHITVNGKEVAGSDLVYSWKVNDTLLDTQSGYGKSSIEITPPRFGAAFTLSVTATSRDGTRGASNMITIAPRTPTAVFYENAALLGVRFDRAAAGSYPFPSDEISFIAYPLFVTDASALSYSWSLDGAAFAVDPAKPRDVTFRKVGSGGGTHTVSLAYSNVKEFLENATRTFTLSF